MAAFVPRLFCFLLRIKMWKCSWSLGSWRWLSGNHRS